MGGNPLSTTNWPKRCLTNIMTLSKWGILGMLMLAIGLLVGRYLVLEDFPDRTDAPAKRPRPQATIPKVESSRFAWRSPDREPSSSTDKPAPRGAIPGQHTVTFVDADAMKRFLESLEGTSMRVMDSMEVLNTLRLSAADFSELDGLLDGSEEIGYIFPAMIPGKGTVQPGALAFGSHYLAWLGAEGERAAWGSDVRVAVLDTGVIPGTPFYQAVYHQHLVAYSGSLQGMNNHGTAVASLIAGENGLAPNASILSYRVAGDDGSSDTFLIAQAVLAAANAGADVINISLGASGQSRILEAAVNYATDAGVVVVASAGNSGDDYLLYPAAYENVIGVGAVDARGEHLDFSNTGNLSIVAPGLGLTSNVGESGRISFSGTSASAPMVSGAIAAMMSQQNTNALGAWQMVQANANEAGAPGSDPAYGAGILDLGRVLNLGKPGIHDLALASNHLAIHTSGNTVLQVTVENRGTAAVINAPVTVQTPLGTNHLNVTTLAPGQIQTFELPIGRVENSVRIESRVAAGEGLADQNPDDYIRVDVLSRAE